MVYVKKGRCALYKRNVPDQLVILSEVLLRKKQSPSL